MILGRYNRLTLLIFGLAGICGCGRRPKPSPQAMDLVRKGALWLRSGDLDRAEASFGLALEYRPRMAEAVNGVALVAFRRGQYKRAEHLFRKALIFNEDLAEAHNNLGVLLCRRKAFGSCRRHLVSALAVDPGYTDARVNLARCLIRQGKLEQARNHLLKATAKDPGRADAWAQLALVSIGQRRLAMAGVCIDRAMRIDPSLAAVHLAQGRLLQLKQAHQAAIVSFKRALKLDPSDWKARHYMAVSLTVLGEPGRALIELRQVLAQKPKNPQVLFATGVALFSMSSTDKAMKFFELATRAKPTLHQARYMLALCLLRTGRRYRGRKLLREMLRQGIDDRLRGMCQARLRELGPL